MTMLKGTCSEFANAFEFVLLYFRSHLHFLLSSLIKDSKGKMFYKTQEEEKRLALISFFKKYVSLIGCNIDATCFNVV